MISRRQFSALVTFLPTFIPSMFAAIVLSSNIVFAQATCGGSGQPACTAPYFAAPLTFRPSNQTFGLYTTAPTGPCPVNGSVYGSTTGLYQCVSGAWVSVNGINGLTVGTTPVTGGTSGYVLETANGAVQQAPTVTADALPTAVSPTGTDTVLAHQSGTNLVGLSLSSLQSWLGVASTRLTVGTTPITGGTSGDVLTESSGLLQHTPIETADALPAAATPSGTDTVLAHQTGNSTVAMTLNNLKSWLGGGTVTSVALSGGTTGLTASASPITSAGVITLGGTLTANNGGTGVTSLGSGVPTALGNSVTGSGSIVLATSPTLTTPSLGTPSAVVLSNATGLPSAAITQSGAVANQALLWNGSTWGPANVPVTVAGRTGSVTLTSGDLTDWATATGGFLTTVAPSTITQGGATTGQALEWSGSAWAPSNVINNFVAGTGLTGGTVANGGTVAVSYGTTSGTTTQGNDSRINNGSILIQQIGHSMGAQAGFMPLAVEPNTPLYVPNTAVQLNQIYASGGWTYRVTTAGTTAASGNGPGTSVGVTGSLVAGSGYTNGTYTGVSLSGGTGSGATATVVVAGNVVTSITLSNVRGTGYTVGDVISPNTATGGMGSVGSGASIKLTSVGLYSLSINDGTAVFQLVPPIANVYNTNILHWVENYSLGRVRWDAEDGYSGPQAGVFKTWVSSPGVGYSASDTWSASGGASGGLTVDGNGHILTATITNPGYGVGIGGATITTSTGSGGAIRLGAAGGGTFSVAGALSSDVALYFAKEAAASPADIIIAGPLTTNDTGPINDRASMLTQLTATEANLASIYKTLLDAGKKVIVLTDPPRSYSVSTFGITFLNSIRQWQREYVLSMQSNPIVGYRQIVIADPTSYMMDGTSTTDAPIGGSGAGAGAMTQEGLHQSQRGAQYYALQILTAASRWIGSGETTVSRDSGRLNGYHSTYNPKGNMIDALPWQQATTYAVNETVTANSNVYYCIVAGLSAATGTGPSGTGGGIVDNIARWNYSRPVGLSVFAGTPTALASPPSGITYSGNYPLGYLLSRSGSASGTVTGAIENPWSDGHSGQRFTLQFSLGSGTSAELWSVTLNAFGLKHYGLQSSDFGVASVYLEAEVEVSGQANLQSIRLSFEDSTDNLGTEAGFNLQDSAGGHLTEAAGSGEMLTMPIKRVVRTPPFVIPTAASAGGYVPVIRIGFDASGAAGSATALVKFNYLGLHRADTH